MAKKAPPKTKKPAKKAPKQKDKESSNEEEEQNEEESSEEEEPAPAKGKGKKKSGGKAAKPKGKEVRKELQTCKLYVDALYEEDTYTWLDKGVEYTV